MPDVWSLLTPALVASVVSIAITNRSDKLKAQREYVTKIVDGARDSVQLAVTAAADYYPLAAEKRTPELESRIWLSERELRFVLSPLVDENSNEEIGNQLQAAFDNFISQLIGGSFQSLAAVSDVKQFRLIAGAGA